MTDARCRLFLVNPPALDAESFAAAFDHTARAGDIASLLIHPSGDRGETLEMIAAVLPAGYEHNIAVLIDEDAGMAAESGADGVQIAGSLDRYREARALLGSDRIVGALSDGSRHIAMELGEAGVDYIAFDQNMPLVFGSGEDLEQGDPISWWTGLFAIPAVAVAPAAIEEVAALVEAGANFIRPEDAMWLSAERAADAVKRYNAKIDECV